MTEYTSSSSMLLAEIEITIYNGLIIPITATPPEQDAEDPIFSIFCYTSNKDIKLLLKINKSTIGNAFQGQDFFKCSQEGYSVTVAGKVLEKTNGYLSILVSDITVGPNNPVFISDELKDHFGIIIQSPTVSPQSTRQATEELNQVEVQTEQYKNFYGDSSDHKMEISSILLDTSVNFDDDFDGISDIQYAVSESSETIDLTHESNKTYQENIIDKSTIEAADNASFNSLIAGLEVSEEEANIDIQAAIRTGIAEILPVDTEIKSDQSSGALEPITVTDTYEISSENQQFPPSQKFLYPSQLVDPVQETDPVNDLVQEKDLRKDIIQEKNPHVNAMPEEIEPIHYMSREEVQDNPTQEESLRNSDIIIKDVAKETLQVNITSEETFSNTPCQQVQLQEDRVEPPLYLSPKVHQAPPITEKNVSTKTKVPKRRKRPTIITNPKDLRRSPRLALKKRVQYFPIKQTRVARKNIVLS